MLKGNACIVDYLSGGCAMSDKDALVRPQSIDKWLCNPTFVKP